MLLNCALSFTASRKATASSPRRKPRRWCPTSRFNSTFVVFCSDISIKLPKGEERALSWEGLSQSLPQWKTHPTARLFYQPNFSRREQQTRNSFKKYLSKIKQFRPTFPTIPHSRGLHQYDQWLNMVYHSNPNSPLPWKLSLLGTFDNRTETNEMSKNIPYNGTSLIAFHRRTLYHFLFRLLSTLMCSSFLILSVDFVHMFHIRDKTSETDAS